MQGQQRRTFRQKSLERLSSPEQLDQLMQVTSPKSWLILSCMGCLVGAALLWSIVGRLPVTVTGRGVLIRPGRVVNLQAPGTGELISLDVQVGDYVRKGQVLGTIAQPELEKQLQQQRTKLAELQNQTENAKLLQSQRTRSELEAIAQQRQNLQQRIEAATTFTTVLQSRGIESLQQRRQNLEQQLKQAQTLVPVLQNRLKRRQELLEAGALSGDALLDAQQVYLDSVRQVADLADQLKELDVREVETKKNYQENLTNIADLKTQLQALDSQERKLAEQNLDALTNRGNQIQEVKRTIAQLEVQLTNNGQITSPYSGRIIELTATVGQLFSSSAIRLGSIEVEDQTSQLVALTYFPVRDGKQVQPKMKLQITPDMVKRERFGGVIGVVETVSAFPVTQQGAIHQIGNPELVQSLISQDAAIEVLARLEPDRSTVSRYRWSSSQGPPLKLTPGTTTTVRVIVEERAPITFIFPIFRSFTGIY